MSGQVTVKMITIGVRVDTGQSGIVITPTIEAAPEDFVVKAHQINMSWKLFIDTIPQETFDFMKSHVYQRDKIHKAEHIH